MYRIAPVKSHLSGHVSYSLVFFLFVCLPLQISTPSVLSDRYDHCPTPTTLVYSERYQELCRLRDEALQKEEEQVHRRKEKMRKESEALGALRDEIRRRIGNAERPSGADKIDLNTNREVASKPLSLNGSPQRTRVLFPPKRNLQKSLAPFSAVECAALERIAAGIHGCKVRRALRTRRSLQLRNEIRDIEASLLFYICPNPPTPPPPFFEFSGYTICCVTKAFFLFLVVHLQDLLSSSDDLDPDFSMQLQVRFAFTPLFFMLSHILIDVFLRTVSLVAH